MNGQLLSQKHSRTNKVERVRKNLKVEYYYCNRSGVYKSESKGLRSLKTQGSSKMNAYCTAGFQVSFLESSKVKITYMKTHYGHSCSLGYLPIPQDIRQQILVQNWAWLARHHYAVV